MSIISVGTMAVIQIGQQPARGSLQPRQCTENRISPDRRGPDPVSFLLMNMEMGYLTPPFGFNLFYMKAIAPPGVTMTDIYRSIVPFVALQAIGLIIVIIFPEIALWLPRQMTR